MTGDDHYAIISADCHGGGSHEMYRSYLEERYLDDFDAWRVGVSQPGPADVEAMPVLGLERTMWGSDYPHNEGTGPYTREHLRQLFSNWDPGDLQQVLAGTAAKLYHFDLDALRPHVDEHGPTVAEIARPLTELPEKPNEALLKGVRRAS